MPKLLDYRKNAKSLRTPGRKVDIAEINSEEFCSNIEQMKEILAMDGVGLAAPQVGWSVQVFMLCIDENGQQAEPKIFLNAEITDYAKKQIKIEEGCLSFKGLYLPIKRPEKIKWSYTSLEGARIEVESEGFYARAVQHEVDHCQGKLFIDRASPVQKMKIKKWLKA